MTDDELRRAALAEAFDELYRLGRLGDPWPPAIAEQIRRRGRS